MMPSEEEKSLSTSKNESIFYGRLRFLPRTAYSETALATRSTMWFGVNLDSSSSSSSLSYRTGGLDLITFESVFCLVVRAGAAKQIKASLNRGSLLCQISSTLSLSTFFAFSGEGSPDGLTWVRGVENFWLSKILFCLGLKCFSDFLKPAGRLFFLIASVEESGDF